MASAIFDRRLVSLTAPFSMEAEQYQALRLKLERLQVTNNMRVVAVTSPGARDGKTVTTINLAAALSQGSKMRVLLIEADLRRPSVARYLRLDGKNPVGLAQLLGEPHRNTLDAVQRLSGLGFDLITAGPTEVPVHELFRQPRLKALLDEARERYDFVLLDTPPVGPVSDCALLGRWLDGLLLVVAAHKTPRKALEKALNMLDGTPVLGIVFNRDDTAHFGYRRQDYRSYFAKGSRRSSVGP
jgi:capsular exopolysaccharide synthesis family protein